MTAAAAMVVGANVGTTSTALFAIIGATPAAKRAALAHVTFNVITAMVAIATLPLMLAIVTQIASLLRLDGQPATLLAIFHTLTNVVGLLIMLPAMNLLVRQLEARFKVIEGDESQPRYLDHNVQSTPSLALDALAMELDEMGRAARQAAGEALNSETRDSRARTMTLAVLEKINLAVGEFAAGIHRQESDSLLSAALPNALRVAQYWVNVGEHALELQHTVGKAVIDLPALAEEVHHLRAEAVAFLGLFDPPGTDSQKTGYQTILSAGESFEKLYDSTKNHILIAGARGQISPSRMAAVLEQLNAVHRLITQSRKAAYYLELYNQARQPSVEKETDLPSASPVSPEERDTPEEGDKQETRNLS
jgi:phosphate:Na+ symporter